MVFGYHTGQRSKMSVKHFHSFRTVAAKDLAQGIVNAIRLESAAKGWVNVKVDV